MKIAGVIGQPVGHSLSPILHRYWLAQQGIAGDYRAIAVTPEGLGDFLDGMIKQGLVGVNVTIPHKEAVMGFLHDISPLARRVGAVNLVTSRNDGSLYGDNSDVYGFCEAVGQVPSGRAVILGAGGAGRAILVGCQNLGITEMHVVNRDVARAENLAAEFGAMAQGWDAVPELLEGAGLLVNTTSLGMVGQPPLAVALDGLRADAVVFDCVYRDSETDILKAATARGLRCGNGLEMLVWQAVPSFAAFYGVTPVVDDGLWAVLQERM